MYEPLSESEAREALQYVSPDCDRDTWFSVVGAIKRSVVGAFVGTVGWPFVGSVGWTVVGTVVGA